LVRAEGVKVSITSLKETEIEEISLLYADPKDKIRDEQDGIIGYRAVRSVIVGGSYYAVFAENWEVIWADSSAKMVYIRIFHKIAEMMQPLNVWEGDAKKLQDYFPELGRSIIYESLRWLKDNQLLTTLDRKTFFVNPDLVWKGQPALMGRAPRGYRFAQKPKDWQRWPEEKHRVSHNCRWFQDDGGVYWKLS
jgi:hypothetical protein